MDKKIKFYKWPVVVSIIFIAISFFDWPYGYYTFMKFVVTASAVYYAYYFYEIEKQNFWFWFLVAVAILFNPIIPIHLGDKTVWEVIDAVVVIFLISFIYKFKDK